MPPEASEVGHQIRAHSAQRPDLPHSTSFEVFALTDDHQSEVLDFLSIRPIHTVCMASFIRDNGIISCANRGVFYGCRNKANELEGVALIGHATLVETQNKQVLKAFAGLKQPYFKAHLIRGELKMVHAFWHYYHQSGSEPHLACRELLLEQETVSEIEGAPPELQPAKLEHLEALLEINSQFVLRECGVNPLKKDPIGFRKRLVCRIEKQRIWVCLREGRLLFKVDVFAQTPEIAYLEGVFVNPNYRGQGHGLRCLKQAGKLLLARSRSICLLINERNKNLANFYKKAGFEERGIYASIYLSPHEFAPVPQ